MAQSINNLTVGSKVIDERGNKFIVISKTSNYDGVLLWSEEKYKNAPISKNVFNESQVSYENSDINYDLNYEYPKTLGAIKNFVLNTNLRYTDIISSSQKKDSSITVKYFLLSITELGITNTGGIEGSKISFFNSSARRKKGEIYWTRTERYNHYYNYGGVFYSVDKDGSVHDSSYPSASTSYAIYPAFNVGTNLLVSDEVSDGYYTMIFNNPPVINTINNIKGNYGSATKISYTATDSDDTMLKHYISFDNGSTWGEIKPSKVGNTYTYTHVFNELKNHSCRIKVVDTAGNETVSNMFIVEVSSSAPTVNIVSVIDKVITFKVNCITDEISKVKVLINDVVKKTYTNNFDFNLVYEINSADLKVGDNKVEIKATSSADIVNTKYLEVSKKSYALPSVGTKVLINGIEYSITITSNNGSTHTYTLDKNLLTNLKANDIVRVMQDRVNVKCSLSNVSANKDFKDMKLVKSKILKGDFEGYIEEKYELEGEGRYSTIRLELERFNSSNENEIIELQQAFDYMED